MTMRRPAWLDYVGAAVSYRRTALGLTQQELCDRIAYTGFLRTHLSRVERCRHDVSLELLARIATALGCTVAQLVESAEKWAALDASAGAA